MLSKQEFDILFQIYKVSGAVSQRALVSATGYSLGKINGIIKKTVEKGYLAPDGKKGYVLCERGLEELQSHKVDNAIIMAAGMSSRFVPYSYEKPKGLITVKGEILIERQIRQLNEAGINDITVVVGYMQEKFFYLKEKYGVDIIVNPEYYKYNNTSTLIRVLNRLGNSYICSSDNYFTENVFEPYVYQSYYAAVYTAGNTDEYCLTTGAKGRITRVSIGGRDAWYMLGHAYFDSHFSTLFAEILAKEYKKNVVKENLWESFLADHLDVLEIYMRKYEANIIYEFDTLDELKTFDKDFIYNCDSKIFDNISKILKCSIDDIVNVTALKYGITNTSFKFTAGEKSYIYRHPGKGTENYINRKSEAYSMSIASRLGLDDTFIYMDEDEGWKLSKYIENAEMLDYANLDQVRKAVAMIRKLHDEAVKSPYSFNVWEKIQDFISLLEKADFVDTQTYSGLYDMTRDIYERLKADHVEPCLCHCDCYSPNILFDDSNNMYLIDWEYSGNEDPACDMGTFICCSDYSVEEAINIIKLYLGEDPSENEIRHQLGYVAIMSLYWYLWALYQEVLGKTAGEYLFKWCEFTKIYGRKTLEMYE